MKIRSKAALSVAHLMIILLVLFYYIFDRVIMSSVSQIEYHTELNESSFVRHEIDHELDKFDGNVRDWGAWNDTYEFIQDKNEGYRRANFNVGTLGSLGVDLLVFMDLGGGIVDSVGYNNDDDIILQPPEDLKAAISPYADRLKNLKIGENVADILKLNGGYLLFTAWAITDSEWKKPVKGTIMAGKWIDERFIDKMAIHTGDKLQSCALPDGCGAKLFEKAVPHFSHSTEPLINVLDKKHIESFVLISDIDGDPAVIVRVERERTIIPLAKRTEKIFLICFLITAFILIVAVIILVDRLILARVMKISAYANAVARSDAAQAPLSMPGNDEIAHLVSDINAMISFIDRRDRRLRSITECLTALGSNHVTNVQSLVSLCGELLGADAAFYEVLDGDKMRCVGGWKLPADYNMECAAKDHLCTGFIESDRRDTIVVRDLMNLPEATYDPYIIKYRLKSYVGKTVVSEGASVAILCTLYREDFEPSDEDLRIIEIVAAALGSEEDRMRAVRRLHDLNDNLENIIDKRTKEVRLLLKQKDSFINQLSHDLKTPLVPLIGLLPLLEGDLKGSQYAEDITLIRRNVDFIKILVDRTISLARLNNEGYQIVRGEVMLKDEVASLIGRMNHYFAGLSINVENNIDDSIAIIGDKLLLAELFQNLFDNATNYMGGAGRISVDSKRIDGFVELSISDSGIGMSEDQIQHFFDEFWKGDISRTDSKSSGLGTTIVKKIVEKHGGRIWVTSSGLGKGTAVHFTLPIV